MLKTLTNLEQDALETALTVLQNKGILLYPTDTIWGIGCDARSDKAVNAIYQLKQRDDAKALICLVSDEEMLQKIVGEIPSAVRAYLTDSHPTTIIYPHSKGLSQVLGAPDGSIGIRWVKDPFCNALIQRLGAPLVSTSANLSGQPSPQSFAELSPRILSGVDHVVPLRQKETNTQASRIVRLNKKGAVEILRD